MRDGLRYANAIPSISFQSGVLQLGQTLAVAAWRSFWRSGGQSRDGDGSDVIDVGGDPPKLVLSPPV
jgi:hypothetical protein